jgi:alkanesulfonate monooxygenase SsuD/methylene tetrahydromethanopterin reductase-like flavin-dependent oxidoreductase (luciferase family)
MAGELRVLSEAAGCELRIGLQLSQPVAGLSPRDAIVEYTRIVETAAGAGFDSFWAGQHFLADEYQLFQPLPLLARLSASVPQLTLGTSVLLLPLLNPLEVAEQAATIDAMAGGGFQLGVGLGYRQVEFDASGIARAEALTRFLESIELIRRLWSGEQVAYEGSHFRLSAGRINPPPAQRDGTSILIGAHAERAVERAGRIGDGWIVPPELGGRALQRRLELFRHASASASRPGTVALIRPFHVTTSAEEKRAIERLLEKHFAQKRTWGLRQGKGDTSDPGLDARAAAIIGSPTDCLEAIRRYEQEAAPDHLVLLMGFRGAGTTGLFRSLELAGELVLPGARN